MLNYWNKSLLTTYLANLCKVRDNINNSPEATKTASVDIFHEVLVVSDDGIFGSLRRLLLAHFDEQMEFWI